MDETESGFMSAWFAAWLHIDIFYNLGILEKKNLALLKMLLDSIHLLPYHVFFSYDILLLCLFALVTVAISLASS